jgi:hypothetical protein
VSGPRANQQQRPAAAPAGYAMSGPHTEVERLYPLGAPYPELPTPDAVRLFAVIVDEPPARRAVHFAVVERWPDAAFDVGVWPEFAAGRAVLSVEGRAGNADDVPVAADRVLREAGWIRSEAWERVGSDGYRAPVVRVAARHTQVHPG